MEKLLELIGVVERSVAVLSGYVRGRAILLSETEEVGSTITINENDLLFVSTDTDKRKEELTVDFNFTKKELAKMSKEFQKTYVLNGLTLHVRQHKGVYEIRYRKDGLSLSASSKTLGAAKDKMKALLLDAYALTASLSSPAAPAKKKAVDYCRWYIETVKKPTISGGHYRNMLGYLRNDLAPFFGERLLSEVSYHDLQTFINGYVEDGKYRTAVGVRTLLREIYKSALLDGEILVDNAARIKPISYEQVHGRALTRDEEKNVVEAILRSGSAHANDYLIMLFTGCRPCELSTIRYEGDFVLIDSAKQRKGKSNVRRCPMTPMFRRYVDVTVEPSSVLSRQLERSFALICPNLKPYDFRHTFITRAQECGVPVEVVQTWVGHSSRTLMGRTYTHYSDEFLLEMAGKIDY